MYDLFVNHYHVWLNFLITTVEDLLYKINLSVFMAESVSSNQKVILNEDEDLLIKYQFNNDSQDNNYEKYQEDDDYSMDNDQNYQYAAQENEKFPD